MRRWIKAFLRRTSTVLGVVLAALILATEVTFAVMLFL